jgi:hypothetical protein
MRAVQLWKLASTVVRAASVLANIFSSILRAFLALRSRLLRRYADVKQLIPKNGAQPPNGPKRFRIMVNDGQHNCYLMVASQMVQDLEANAAAYKPGAILECQEILANDVSGRRWAKLDDIVGASVTRVAGSAWMINSVQLCMAVQFNSPCCHLKHKALPKHACANTSYHVSSVLAGC